MRPSILTRICFAALAALTLAACQHDMAARVYLSDLRAVSGGGAPVRAPATYRTEILLGADCAEAGATLAAAFGRDMPDAVFLGCDTVDVRQLARFRALIPLAASAAEIDTVFGLVARPGPEGAALFVQHRPDALARIAERLAHYTRGRAPAPEALTVTLTLVNDSAAPAEVVVGPAYVDGAPVLSETVLTLGPRGEAEITLADVARDLVAAGRPVPVLRLAAAP